MLVFNPSVLNKVVKTMTPQKERVEEAQIRGTIVFSANEHFVRLDGASGDSLTPIANFAEGASDAGFVHGDRVLVLIKNHQAIVTKNLTTGLQAQAAKEAGSFVTTITDEGITAQRIIANDTFTNTLRANEITADEIIAGMATIDQLDANYAHITNGIIDNATIGHADVNDLDANYAHITSGVIDNATIDQAQVNDLGANYAHISNGVIDNAKIGYADVNGLNANYAHISNGVIDNAKIGYADVQNLNAHYAQIDIANVNNAWIENGAIKKAAVFDENVFDLSGDHATLSRIDASKINVANLRADNLVVRRINGQPVVGGYTLIDSNSSGYASKNPQALGWYEFVNAQWVLSTDTTVDMTKAYYQTGNEVSLYDQAYIDGLEDDLQQQIDGAVETFTGSVVPTLVNWPYTDWYDTSVTPVHDERAKHVGDIYYVVNSASDENGYCYRFAYDNTSHAYSWVLIKDSDVTKALGDISELQTFESTTTSWMDETDEGLETIRTNHTTLSGVVDKTVKSTVQLWFTKANTTAPSKPTSHITSTSTSGNAWRKVVPVYNASYPYYYYCYEHLLADGGYIWSDVVRDVAMEESQSTSRTAKSTADANIKSTVQLWFTKADTTAPDAPTAHVTSTSTSGNAWRTVVPSYNASYPYYYYCYEYQKGDNSYAWSAVVRDRAMEESQSVARAALPASTFTSFESTTFKDVKDTVTEHSTTFTNMTTRLGMNSDGTGANTDIVAKESALEQTVDGISTRVGKTETKLIGMYATSSTAAGTAAKVATITPALPSGATWELGTGTIITVKFTNANTTSSPTLNVNSKGAKAIKTYANGNLSEAEYKWEAGSTFTFVYNGTNWLMQDSSVSVRMNSAETSITENAEQIALRAKSSDVYTKEQVYTKTEADSAITQKANEISLSVAQTEISKIEVGGRNLILNSATERISPASESGSAYVSPTCMLTEYGSNILTNTDDSFVYSFDYEVTGNSSSEGFIYTQAKGTMISGSNRMVLDAPTGHYTHVFKLNSTQASSTSYSMGIRLRLATDGAVLRVRNIKLEKGNKATDWTPAPEDVDAQIDGIEIGGRNLLIGTADPAALTTAANRNWFSPIVYKLSEYANTAIADENNTQITVSFDYSITGVDTAFNMTASLCTASVTYNAGVKVAEVPVGDSNGHAVGTRDILSSMRQFAPNNGIMISGSGNANANAQLTISNVKLEFGTKATDWTPAPEDLENYADSAVAIAKAEIKVTTDSISTEVGTKVGNSEIISKINQSAETIKIQASKVEIDGTATFNAIKSSADATYDSKGSASAVQTNLDNLEIGGRNLLRNSGTYDGWLKNDGVTSDGNILDINVSGATSNLFRKAVGSLAKTFNELNGETCVVSFEVYCDDWSAVEAGTSTGALAAQMSLVTFNATNDMPVTGYTLRRYRYGNLTDDTLWNQPASYANGEWIKITSKPFSVPEVFTSIDVTTEYGTYVGVTPQLRRNGHVKFRNIKWEIGNKATDWSPAPEDSLNQEQYIYKQAVNGTTSMTGTTTWITATTESVTAGTPPYSATGLTPVWTTKRPSYQKNYPVLFVAKQTKTVGGLVTCTTPLIDDTTTIIDGGKIITGSVTANKLDASDINASNSLTIGALSTSTQDDILNSNIEIGGRNLLLGTGTAQTVTLTDASSNYYIGYFEESDYGKMQTNGNTTDYMAVSFDWSTTSSTGTAWIQIDGNIVANIKEAGGCYSENAKDRINLADGSGHYYAIFKLTSTQAGKTTQRMRLRIAGTDIAQTAGSTFTLKNLKFEIGTKATDWTSAPEDTEADISSVQDELTSTRTWYATCDTAAATVAKVATITPATTEFTSSIMTPGTTVFVKFTNTNSGAVGSLTLSVNGTTAKNIKYINNTAISNIPDKGYIVGGQTYQFTYDGTYWVIQNLNYNTNNYDRTAYKASATATGAISSARIGVFNTSGKLILLSTTAFDITRPILYIGTAYTADALTQTNNYTFWGTAFNLTNTHAITGAAAGKPVYIVGTLSGTTFTPNSTVLTCTVPSSADGLVYIRLGLMSTSANAVLEADHPMYMYFDGKFQQCDPATASAACTATTYITHIDNNGIRIHPSSTENNSVVINASGTEVFKGGTGSANSVAFYGDTVRIGKTDSRHVEVNDGGLQVVTGSSTILANIGYGQTNTESGTGNNPYLTIGTRASGSAIGSRSLSVGANVIASGTYSLAGGTTIESTENGVTFSRSSTASGNWSFAFGAGCLASGRAAAAFGTATTASWANQFVVGRFNELTPVASNAEHDIFTVGNGISNSNRKTVFAVTDANNVYVSGNLIGANVAKDVSSSFIPYSTSPFNNGTINAYQVGNLISIRYKLPAVSLNTSTTVALFSIYPDWRPKTENIFQASITDSNYTHLGTGVVRIQTDGWVYMRTPASMSQTTGLYVMFNGVYIC